MELVIYHTIQQPQVSEVTTAGMALLFIVCTIVLTMMSWEERRNTKRRDGE